MPLKVADAFVTKSCWSGNPAGVVKLEGEEGEALFKDEDWMQKVALENAYSETAFLVGSQGEYKLRWFTPTAEVDLCG